MGQNTIFVVCGIAHVWDFTVAEIAVPLHPDKTYDHFK
jgi:hypothetical protein